MSVSVVSTVHNTQYDSDENRVYSISIRVRRKTRSQWMAMTSAEQRIPAGEACYATDTGELRIGTYRDVNQPVASIYTVNDNLYSWEDLPNVLGIANQVKLDSNSGSRYLCIDDGDLDV